jgi:phosphomannomutase
MTNIKFGTDGWRAVVGLDFNEENVEIVTNAIGKYVLDNFGSAKKILIGFDPRNKAYDFAFQCAKILFDAGFNVMISNGVVPTPVLAYSAKFYDACAVMFTASHNPPEYLGMKFIPDYAGPATSEITDSIVANIGSTLEKKMGGVLTEINFGPRYFEHIRKLVDVNKIQNLEEKIIFDGFYSATIGYFDKLLEESSIKFNSINMHYDVNFGGGMPDPKPKYLKDLIQEVNDNPVSVGLANDGDGDRFGVINENGDWVSPNEIIAILTIFLKKYKKLNGKLVKTVGASLLLDKVAEKIGVEVVETPVGFKHVGAAMRETNALIGGEESGGLSIQGHIPEKDGILANLLVLEAMAVQEKSLVELQKDLYDLVGMKFYNERVDKKLKNREMIDEILETTKNAEEIEGFKVLRKDFKDGVKLYFDDNSSWILVRPSGTEPLLRIYFESDNSDKIEKLKEYFKD